jgi:hypothetical protein
MAIVAPIPSIIDVASYPPGTSMRPMGAVGMITLGGAAGLLIALPLALVGLILGRRRRAGVVLGLYAAFGDSFVFHSVVESRGYVMEP